MDIMLRKEIFIDTILRGYGSQITDSCLRRLLHNVAELACQQKIPLAGHQVDLDLQRHTADRSPGEPAHDTDLVRIVGRIHSVLFGAEKISEILPGHLHTLFLLLQDHSGSLPADMSDLPLELAHTGLTRILHDHIADRFIGNEQLILPDSVRLLLLGNQMFFGDVMLFIFGIGSDLDHLHTVQERPRDRIRVICRSDKEHVRQVDGYLNIMVFEMTVLLGIKDLQQRGSCISLVIAAQLIDLVEHHQRISDSRFAKPCRDPARHRTDVCPAMAADLRLVADSAERQSDILFVQRFGDRAADGCLAGTGRSDKAQDRARPLCG